MTSEPLPEAIHEFAAAPAAAHLATTLPDGAPHVVPLWFGIEDGRLVFFTEPGSRKARNLDRDPRLAMSIVAPDEMTYMASVRGRVAEIVDGDAGWAIIDRMSQRYQGKPYPRDLELVAYVVDAEKITVQRY